MGGVAAVIIGAVLPVAGGIRLHRHGNRIAWAGLVGLSLATALSWRFSPTTVPLATALTGAWLSGWAVRFLMLSLAGGRRPVAAIAAHLHPCLLIGLGFFAILGRPETQTPDSAIPDSSAPEKVVTPAFTHRAMTDSGRPISLGADPFAGRLCSHDEELTAIRRAGLEANVIRTGPAAVAANCHGWVFSGARWWISGEDVESILDDNGYEPVTAPQPGDLVVYRDAAGGICHSGVVKVVAPDRLVLVESKWGLLGSFLHRPEEQIFSNDWSFHRSLRRGHLLRKLPDAPNNTAPRLKQPPRPSPKERARPLSHPPSGGGVLVS